MRRTLLALAFVAVGFGTAAAGDFGTIGGSGGSTGGGAVTGPLGTATAPAAAVSVVFPAGATLPAFATTPSVLITGPLGSGTVAANAVAVVPANGSLFVVNAGVNSASSLWGSVSNTAAASGGISTFSRIPSSAATTNLTGIKSTPGRAYVVRGCNTTAATIYLKLYNIAIGAVTVGTSTVFDSFAFPANVCTSHSYLPVGSSYSVAITYAMTTGPLDTDTGALTAGAMTQVVVGVQ